MDTLADELAIEGFDVAILGVNEAGHEAGNPSITTGRDLPWLQDTPEADVWHGWGITFRDVVILDEENEVVAIYNLTQNTLADPAKYAELKALFAAAATR